MTTAGGSGRLGPVWFPLAIVAALALKFYVVAANGGDRLGDDGAFLQFSDTILGGWSWLHDAELRRYAIPPTLWKPPGYPLLMAAARLLLGGDWAWGLFALQAAASLIAGLFLRRLALACGLGAAAATAAFLAYEFSLPVSTDALLMADGLYGSLGTIILALVGRRLALGKALSLPLMAGAGILLLACLLLREVFFYLFIPMGLAFVLPALAAGERKGRAVMLLGVFCLPTALGAAALMAWNDHRVGQPMLTSGGQTAFLLAVQQMAKREPAVFDGDTPLDRVARAVITDYDYPDTIAIDQALFREDGLAAPALANLAERKYFATAERFPRVFIMSLLDRLNLRLQATLCGDVLARLDDLDWWRFDSGKLDYNGGWRGEAKAFLARWDTHLLSVDVVVHVLPRLVLRAVSGGLFLLFAVGLPLLLLRDLREGTPYVGRQALLAALYALYWSTVALHSLVNLELRYLGAVLAVPILGSLLVVSRLYAGLRRSAAEEAPAPAARLRAD